MGEETGREYRGNRRRGTERIGSGRNSETNKQVERKKEK